MNADTLLISSSGKTDEPNGLGLELGNPNPLSAKKGLTGPPIWRVHNPLTCLDPVSTRECGGPAVINPSVASRGDVKQRPCRSRQPAKEYDETEAAVEGIALTLHRVRKDQNPAEGLMHKASATISRGGLWIDCAQCLVLWRSQAGYPNCEVERRAAVLFGGLLSVSLCQAEPFSSFNLGARGGLRAYSPRPAAPEGSLDPRQSGALAV